MCIPLDRKVISATLYHYNEENEEEHQFVCKIKETASISGVRWNTVNKTCGNHSVVTMNEPLSNCLRDSYLCSHSVFVLFSISMIGDNFVKCKWWCCLSTWVQSWVSTDKFASRTQYYDQIYIVLTQHVEGFLFRFPYFTYYIYSFNVRFVRISTNSKQSKESEFNGRKWSRSRGGFRTGAYARTGRISWLHTQLWGSSLYPVSST